jgi:aryl-alcohol dehydrogenase-like predicted oxidoreductase
MRYRRFGRLGWEISDIGYGMWGMGSWTGSDDVESIQSLHRSVELGCNFFDTAWAYGEGHSEKLLGDLVRSRGDQKLYVATKVPPKSRHWPAGEGERLVDNYPPEHIHEYVQRSLASTGLAKLDLVQLHTWRDAWLDEGNPFDSLKELRKTGLIGGIGISLNRWEPWNGIRAVLSGDVDAVQVIYNIFDQNPEDELFPACERQDVGVIARVPFDEGSLTGTLTRDSRWEQGDWRNIYFSRENLDETVQRVEGLKTVLPAGMTLSTMALRFILTNDTVSTTIPGMRKPEHVESNMAASDAGPLNGELFAALKSARWERMPKPWSH